MRHSRLIVLRAIAASALSWPLLSTQVLSQWSHDPAINNAICTAAQEQFGTSIVADASGGAVIAWSDYRAGTDTATIYAQRIDALGVARWTVDGIPVSTTSNQSPQFTMASDGAGGAVIAWDDYRTGTSIPDIYAQLIDSAGVVRWGTGGVSISAGSSFPLLHEPAIVGDNAGGAIIAWKDDRIGSSYYDIYAQHVNAAGIVRWTANGVAICTAANYQGSPMLVSDGAAGAIITWEDVRAGTSYDVYAQRIDSSGVVRWAADGVVVSAAANDQRNPIIVSAGAAGAIITWNDFRSGTNTDIYAQRVNSTGVVQWTSNGAPISTAARDQLIPGIVSDGAGGAIISWLDNRGGTSYDSYAQRINSAGVVQGTTDGVAVKTAAGSPKMTSDGAGGAIITWHSSGDIHAQRINGSAVVQWDTNGVAISTAANGQGNPRIVSDGARGAIIAWDDLRGGTNSDIYAQHLNADGSLGGVTGVNNWFVVPLEFTLRQNYPNPFNPSTTITYELPKASHVTLKIYDLLGREVAVLVDEDNRAGVHHARFDAINLSSGTYLYRIQAEDFVETKKLLVIR